MKTILRMLLLSFCLAAPVFSENTIGDISGSNRTSSNAEVGIAAVGSSEKFYERLLLSLSAEDYPVTPGDTYRLSYITAGAAITTEAIVASDCTVNLGVLGIIDAEGLTFPILWRRIEQRILSAYPDSSPSITILSNGQFRIFLMGEVTSAGHTNAWGLTHLSSVVRPYITPYSSIRDVMIISKSGIKKKYDLFKAERFGDRAQDPYVHPDDTIVVGKRDRAIQLSGEVKREGVYQPLPNEGLKELIEYYGDGFTETADPSRIRLQRLITGSNKIAESFIVDLNENSAQSTELRDLDKIIIPRRTEYLPVIFIEGAISSSDEVRSNIATNKLTEQYNKITIPFADGETLYSVLNARQKQIYPNADLENAYIISRDRNSVRPVNLETLLYSSSPQDDVVLEPYARLVIPFRQYSVLVTGGVIRSGQYPYLPNKTYDYYIDLAGGADSGRGNLKRVKIIDRENNSVPNDSFIEPETRIHVPYSFSYYFNRYFPVVASSATLISSVILLMERR